MLFKELGELDNKLVVKLINTDLFLATLIELVFHLIFPAFETLSEAV